MESFISAAAFTVFGGGLFETKTPYIASGFEKQMKGINSWTWVSNQ